MCPVIADFGQRLIAVFYHRRAFIRTHRVHGLNHIRYLIGVCHHDFKCLVTSQIIELLQHFICGM